MREIKFRMWNEITKKMIDLKKITPLALNIDTDGLFIPYCGMPLMQFTGLKDSKGKEIWEGDICKVKYYHGFSFTGKVNFIDEYGAWAVDRDTFYEMDGINDQYEVIGNIYETK